MPLPTIPAPYPLAWPERKPRTPAANRQKGHYSLRTFPQAMGTIEIEVARWQKRDRAARLVDWEVTTNQAGRHTVSADPGAALWFTLAGKDVTGETALMVLACDKFEEVPQNMGAVSLTWERLRRVDDVGAYSLVSAVEGARALPPPADYRRDAEIRWRETLGVGDNASLLVAEAAYPALAKNGGEGSPRLRDLNPATETARRELPK